MNSLALFLGFDLFSFSELPLIQSNNCNLWNVFVRDLVKIFFLVMAAYIISCSYLQHLSKLHSLMDINMFMAAYITQCS